MACFVFEDQILLYDLIEQFHMQPQATDNMLLVGQYCKSQSGHKNTQFNTQALSLKKTGY